MKQVLQNLKSGKTEVANVSPPILSPGYILIRTRNSVISAGTERMLVEFGRANLLQKAQQQPDKVKQAIQKIQTDGLSSTIQSITNKLDKPLPLGYSNAGEVIAIGSGVSEFRVGDRVISNGYHAEIVSVPAHLCAKIPDNVNFKTASYTVLASIALQGIRLAQPTLGENILVMGLGLIGLFTVQLLKAQGSRVIASDYDESRLKIAQKFGAEVVNLKKGERLEDTAEVFSNNQGIDAVLITASTKSSEPVSLAASVCRKRGRIVLVGVTGLELSRADFYKKELSFQVSCSYGPGRYETAYEDKGYDYPIGFVRWTEQRNFEAVLHIMSEGNIVIDTLTSHEFPIEQAETAYKLIQEQGSSLGIVLKYPHNEIEESNTLKPRMVHGSNLADVKNSTKTTPPSLAFIGAGNYASAILVPAFKSAGANLLSISSQGGASAYHLSRKYGFTKSFSRIEEIFACTDVHAIVISTRHDSHAELVQKALQAGKHVFVEKPLCLNQNELQSVYEAYQDSQNRTNPPILMLGFNRRFSAHVQKIHSLLEIKKQPASFIMTVNAGKIPSDHWTQDIEIGGGRIIGEACHFIDLLRYLASSKIRSWHKTSLMDKSSDTVSISLEFENGSIGTIHYFSNGAKSLPKERLEIFAGNSVLQLDNFIRLKGHNWPQFSKLTLSHQDKGQKNCALAFCNAVKNNFTSPIPANEIFEVSNITIDIAQ